jgi:hypothetical protein
MYYAGCEVHSVDGRRKNVPFCNSCYNLAGFKDASKGDKGMERIKEKEKWAKDENMEKVIPY